MIHAKPPLVHFAAAIHRRHPLTLLVVEARRRGPAATAWRRLRAAWATASLAPLRQAAPLDVRSRSQARLCDRVLGPAWRRLPEDVPLLVVSDINDPQVVARLRALRPDCLLDHGTSIVRREVLATAPVALNVHWGLSPYYRGTHCTAWALLNWDPHNVGVTVHRLSARIDGGDVFAQARVGVAADDTVESINLRLTCAGAELAAAALDRLARGEALPFVRQELSRGLLTLNRQWGRPLRRQVARLVGGGLGTMLRRPARERLPIVELPEDAGYGEGADMAA
jgi:hypothetical protein